MPIADSDIAADDDTSSVDDTPISADTPDDTPVDDSVVSAGTDAPVGTDATAAETDPSADDGTDGGTETVDDSWRRQYEELGFQDLDTPEQAQQRLIESFRQERERADYASEQARYHQSLVARLGQPGTDTQSPAAAQSPTPADEPETVFGKFTKSWVEVDRDTIAEFVDQDENGNPTWKPDTPPELRAQVHQAQAAQRKWNEVIQDPRQLSQAIEQQIESLVGTRLNSVLSERETMSAEEQAEQKFIAENEWLYAVDPITNQRTNQPSAEGRVFGSHLNRARELGITSKAGQIEYAMAMFKSSQQAVNPDPVPQPQQTQEAAAQQRADMLGRTNTRPAAPTTAAGISDGPASAPSGESRMSLGETMLHSLKENRLA